MRIIIFLWSIIMPIFSYSQDALPDDKISHRPPTVSGTFYPADPDSLRSTINRLLDPEKPKKFENQNILGIVVPHAGYEFSGITAGRAYKELSGRKYDAVIIIAPSHHVSFKGASVFSGDAYVTPLGVINVDKQLSQSISADDKFVRYSMDGHKWSGAEPEHSLEVQLPFLQVVLPGTPIVPIVMGTQDLMTEDKLMQAIVKAVKESKKHVLLVASSDLSHFHSYDTARSIDIPGVKTFGRYDYFAYQNLHSSGKIEACGGGPIVTVMMACEQLGAVIAAPVSYMNSGDTEKGKSSRNRVVGYFSGLFIATDEIDKNSPPMIDENSEIFLMDLAKKSVRQTVTGVNESNGNIILPVPLTKNYAAFVTLRKKGNLRACMGHTYPTENVAIEVFNAAELASTSDYRFGAVKEKELDSLDYEITVLSRFRRILDFNEIQIGKDGLFIRLKNQQGLLLPQVASERNWSVKEFLRNVSDKAGLPTDAYLNPDAQLFAFRAQIIEDKK